VIASRYAHPPIGAWDDRGNDVLHLIAQRDRKYVTSFEDLPFAGFAKLHWIELDLVCVGCAKTAAIDHRRVHGLFHGDFDVRSGSGRHQSDSAVRGSPRCARQMGARRGRYGVSAGLERTMVADLTGKLPSGTRRIRIVNNLKIYWDAIRIDQTPDMNAMRVPKCRWRRRR